MRSGSINAIHKMSTAREETSGGILRGSADIGASCLVACSVDVELACAVETYAGEWKWDKRCGFGVSERSDGLKFVPRFISLVNVYGLRKSSLFKINVEHGNFTFENETLCFRLTHQSPTLSLNPFQKTP